MEITEVKVFPVGDPKLKAFVSIVFDRYFMVNDLRVIEGKQGLFVSMPNRKRRNGEIKDVAHPLNRETRSWIEERILAEFGRVAEGDGITSLELALRPAEGGGLGRSEGTGEIAVPGGEPEKSLEEVQQAHLRESFWSLT